MLKYLAAYGGAALAFVVLDGLWLSLVAPKIYRPILGDLLTGQVRVAPAIAFYVLYVLGVVILAVRPALRSGAWTEALVLGMVLGAVAYGAYDLTNHCDIEGLVHQDHVRRHRLGLIGQRRRGRCGVYAARVVTK